VHKKSTYSKLAQVCVSQNMYTTPVERKNNLSMVRYPEKTSWMNTKNGTSFETREIEENS